MHNKLGWLSSMCSVSATLALGACGFSASNALSDASGGHDDASTDGTPGQVQFGSFVKVRFNSLADVPTAPLTFSDPQVNIDTGNDSRCDVNNDKQGTYCVVAAAGITIDTGTTLRATGSKPLLLLSTGSFDLNGTIDVSSVRNRENGAGHATATACPGNTEPTGKSGGYGGSFGGQGGAGEKRDADTQGVAVAAATAFPDTLRGGCPGGSGAGSVDSGGAGGGAVDIIASTIMFNGQINASGESGQGGPANAVTNIGGGGGGAGGMIVLDTSSVTAGSAVHLWLYANGGGGGQGGTNGIMGNGVGAGADGGEAMQPYTPAIGGADGGRFGGVGGPGSAGVGQPNGSAGGGSNGGATGGAGGGGGGGGGGFIRTPAIAGAMISPPAS